MKKVVILLNMGGPNDLSEVKVFLKNMFNDKYILPIPSPFLRSLAAWGITKLRDKEAQSNYKALGGKSPISDITRSLCQKLNSVQNEVIFDFAMNYTAPFCDDVFKKYENCDDMVLFPLYPHHSQTTTLSSLDDAKESAKKYNIKISKIIEYFYEDSEYNAIIRQNILKAAKQNGFEPAQTNLIFSAHSLPQSIINKGDLYEKHTNAHVALLSEGLNFKNITLAYQSRLGPVKWLGPNIGDVLDTLKGQNVLVYPISFCIDCSESDFELAILYKEHAAKARIAKYEVVKAPNDSDEFVKYILNKI